MVTRSELRAYMAHQQDYRFCYETRFLISLRIRRFFYVKQKLYPHYPPIDLSLTATMSLPQLILLAWAASKEEEDETSTRTSTSSLLSPEDRR